MKKVPFAKDEDGAKLMAAFVYELCRRGAGYEVTDQITHWLVEVTGC